MKKLIIKTAAAVMLAAALCPSGFAADRGAADIAAINAASAGIGGGDISRSGAVADAQKGEKQTVFIFMIGSDMERCASYDICEMLDSGFNDADTNVLLIAGGSKSWSIDAMNAHPVGVYRLLEGGLKLLEGTDINIFDTDDIYGLMFRYMARYRAERYSVFFWDHGGGFVSGFGKDESGENESISAKRLAEVFADIKRDVKRDYNIDYSYDIAGFDACFMADIQTASAFAEAGFEYFIGSEDAESFYGWNYGFLGGGSLGAGGEALCRAVIDETARFYDENGVSDYTLSALELAGAGRVVEALEKTAMSVSALDGRAYPDARRRTKTYGNSVCGERFDGGSHDYADMGDFAARLGEAGADTEELKDAVADAVIYNRSTDGSSGISVYSYYSSSKKSLGEWCSLTGDELDAYKRLQIKTESDINGGSVYAAAPASGEIEADGNEYTYMMTEEERENTAGAAFSVYRYEDGAFRLAARVRDAELSDGTVKAIYNGEGAFIINDGIKYPCALELSGGESRIPIAKDEGKRAYAADFKRYSVKLKDGDVIGLVSDQSEALAAKTDASLNNGDRIYAVLEEYSEDNYRQYSVPDILAAHDAEFSEEILTGTYYGRFELINCYGFTQYCSPAVEIVSDGGAEEPESESTVMGEPNHDIIVGGETLSVPCAAASLIAAGYEFAGEPPMLGSGEDCLMTMRRGGVFIDVTLRNFSTGSVSAKSAFVTAIASSDCAGFGLVTGGAFDGAGASAVYETAGTKKYIYALDGAELPELDSGDLAQNGLYNTAAHDYAVIEADKRTGRITRMAVSSESGCSAVSSGRSAAAYEYSAPAALGSDPYSFVVGIEDGVYSVPVPASVLISDGWETKRGEIIPSMRSAEAVFEKNGKRFTAVLVNYGSGEAAAEECIACGIYLDYSDGAAADAALPGGLDLRLASESIAAGRYRDIYNKANSFADLGDSVLYASGTALDYDGGIEITGSGAYIYRRLDGIRSMSGFDRLAKYFVY